LRIAIHNHFAGQEVAETEFSRRISLAAANLGWTAVEVPSSAAINQSDPDFVIALTFRTPKLTKYPTYGSMVNPPSYFSHDDRFVKNILSYDGYLCSSSHIAAWLKDILYLTRKPHFIAPWYTTSHDVPYRPPRIDEPRLFYSGTNWDGPRFRPLLERLAAEPYFDVYGPPNAWLHLKHSYRGALPFDGVSVLNALNRAGAGLCLHRKEHTDAATPSSRIFEIAASGAIAICQEHSFIRDVFRDSVLYLEATDDPERLARQISEYMRWIAGHREAALELSKRAHQIFAEHYTLEKLLLGLASCHQKSLSSKPVASVPRSPALGAQGVELIVRVGGRAPGYVQRALESVKSQTYEQVGVIIVQYEEVPCLAEILNAYSRQIPLRVVQSSNTGNRSKQLWDGLKAVSSQYFGILDDDDLLYPRHLHSLLDLLQKSPDCGVAYSGAIRAFETDPASPSPAGLPSEPAELAYFEPFDLSRLVALDNFITSNSFVARASLLEDLWDDPGLDLLEDLFLLLFLCRKTNFLFSYQATCEFRRRADSKGSSDPADRSDWAAAAGRIRALLFKESFPSTQRIGAPNLWQLQSRVKELETRVNRYLNLPLMSTLRRFRRILLRLPPPGA
jgi:hypothetical protein